MEQLTKKEDELYSDVDYTTTYYQDKVDPPPVQSTQGPIAFSAIESFDYKSRVGWNIPHYHQRKRRGELLPHTSWEHFTAQGQLADETYDFQYVYSGSRYHNYTDTQRYPWPNPMSIEGLRTMTKAYAPTLDKGLVQKAAAEIYTCGFDVLTFLAEFTQSVRMFTNIAKRLAKLAPPSGVRTELAIEMQNLKRFKKRHGSAALSKRLLKGSLKRVSNDWMEGRYGWRTMMYDLDGLAHSLAKLNALTQRYRHTSGSSSSMVEPGGSSQYQPPFNYEISWQTEVKTGLRGSVVADIDIPDWSFNPFMAAWEIIPFSFVIDWVVTVGQSISAMSFATFAKEYSASAGLRVDVDRVWTRKIASPTPSYTWYSGQDQRTWHYVTSYELRVPCQVPLAPRINLNLNPLKILDLTAMVVQRLF